MDYLEPQNRLHGAYGTLAGSDLSIAQVPVVYAEMARQLRGLGLEPVAVRDILDSSVGRHLADSTLQALDRLGLVELSAHDRKAVARWQRSYDPADYAEAK